MKYICAVVIEGVDAFGQLFIFCPCRVPFDTVEAKIGNCAELRRIDVCAELIDSEYKYLVLIGVSNKNSNL